ncbi:hypothetical protein DFQ27_001382 [Actinomortierella ambigua]|uniref:Rap-GAP domain-containing protein n=1 Tax=Actinomortierella ambigua TaxID=1343610 RepID=A0A9P6U8I1_9FUNG|nr:hypothetical protein DFQ27_001382 [Actinomortierella ambigua]
MAHVMQKHIPTEDYRVFLKDTGTIVKLARVLIAESHDSLMDKDTQKYRVKEQQILGTMEDNTTTGACEVDERQDINASESLRDDSSMEEMFKTLDDVRSFIKQVLDKAQEKVKEYADLYHEFIVVPTPGFRVEGINNLGRLKQLAHGLYEIRQRQNKVSESYSSSSSSSAKATFPGTKNPTTTTKGLPPPPSMSVDADPALATGRMANAAGEPMARMNSLPQSRDEWAAVQTKHLELGPRATASELEPCGEHMGHEAYFYRDWFLGKEHRTFVGQVDGLGTVIISIVREQVSNGGPNTFPTRSNTTQHPPSLTHYVHRPELPHTSHSFHYGDRNSDGALRHTASPRASTEGMRAAFGALMSRSETPSLPGSIAATTTTATMAAATPLPPPGTTYHGLHTPGNHEAHPASHVSGGGSGISAQTPPIHPGSSTPNHGAVNSGYNNNNINNNSAGGNSNNSNNNSSSSSSNSNTRWQYRCILRQRDADTIRRTFPEPELGPLNLARRAGKPQWKAVLQLIHPAITQQVASKLRKVQKNNHSFERDLAKFDETMLRFNYKFGVLLVQKGQTREEEWFGNQSEDSPAFQTFLNSGIIGEKVTLKGFDRFAAGLDTRLGETGEYSYFDTWGMEYEIMYHISTMLPYNTGDRQQIQRKRHIGNDIVCIVFVDGVQPFMPTAIKSQFLHIFVLIHEIQLPDGATAYAATIASDEHVPEFGPLLPSPPIFFDVRDLRLFLLSKTINGENAAYKAPRLIKPHQRARSGMLDNLVAKANSLTPDSINTDKANSKFKQKGSSSSLAPLHSANSLLNTAPAPIAPPHPPMPMLTHVTAPNTATATTTTTTTTTATISTKGKPSSVTSSCRETPSHHVQSCPASGASDNGGGPRTPDAACNCPLPPPMSQDDIALAKGFFAPSFSPGIHLEDRRHSLSVGSRSGSGRNSFVTLGSETAASIFKMRRRSSNAADSTSTREELGISSSTHLVLPLKASSTWSSGRSMKRDGILSAGGVGVGGGVGGTGGTGGALIASAEGDAKAAATAALKPTTDRESEESDRVPIASPMMPATQTCHPRAPVSISPSPTKDSFDATFNPHYAHGDSMHRGLAVYGEKERSKSEVDLLSSIYEGRSLQGGGESILPPQHQAHPPTTKKGRAQQFLNTLVRRRASSNDTSNLGPNAAPLSKMALLTGATTTTNRPGPQCSCCWSCMNNNEAGNPTLGVVSNSMPSTAAVLPLNAPPSSPPLMGARTAVASTMPLLVSQPPICPETPPPHPHHQAVPAAPTSSTHFWRLGKDKERGLKHLHQQMHIHTSPASIVAQPQAPASTLASQLPLQPPQLHPQHDVMQGTSSGGSGSGSSSDPPPPSTAMSGLSSRSSTLGDSAGGSGYPATEVTPSSSSSTSPRSFYSFSSHLSDAPPPAAAVTLPTTTPPASTTTLSSPSLTPLATTAAMTITAATVPAAAMGLLARRGSSAFRQRRLESMDNNSGSNSSSSTINNNNNNNNKTTMLPPIRLPALIGSTMMMTARTTSSSSSSSETFSSSSPSSLTFKVAAETSGVGSTSTSTATATSGSSSSSNGNSNSIGGHHYQLRLSTVGNRPPITTTYSCSSSSSFSSSSMPDIATATTPTTASCGGGGGSVGAMATLSESPAAMTPLSGRSFEHESHHHRYEEEEDDEEDDEEEDDVGDADDDDDGSPQQQQQQQQQPSRGGSSDMERARYRFPPRPLLPLVPQQQQQLPQQQQPPRPHYHHHHHHQSQQHQHQHQHVHHHQHPMPPMPPLIPMAESKVVKRALSQESFLLGRRGRAAAAAAAAAMITVGHDSEAGSGTGSGGGRGLIRKTSMRSSMATMPVLPAPAPAPPPPSSSSSSSSSLLTMESLEILADSPNHVYHHHHHHHVPPSSQSRSQKDRQSQQQQQQQQQGMPMPMPMPSLLHKAVAPMLPLKVVQTASEEDGEEKQGEHKEEEEQEQEKDAEEARDDPKRLNASGHVVAETASPAVSGGGSSIGGGDDDGSFPSPCPSSPCALSLTLSPRLAGASPKGPLCCPSEEREGVLLLLQQQQQQQQQLQPWTVEDLEIKTRGSGG